ncbi:hypothetical protein [Ralstonia sp. 25mfcol4.1]|uniref:hypothetical protein n=1 Tax=Ralstonia sp. 25mfcol4.1 TaxID=1761899 RepID=UPI0004901857|nr:hypothetical protein [Ralstonia sp. 25mfcol4.1]
MKRRLFEVIWWLSVLWIGLTIGYFTAVNLEAAYIPGEGLGLGLTFASPGLVGLVVCYFAYGTAWRPPRHGELDG